MDLKFLVKESLYDAIEDNALFDAQQKIDAFVALQPPTKAVDDSWCPPLGSECVLEESSTAQNRQVNLPSHEVPGPGCTATCGRQRMNLLAN